VLGEAELRPARDRAERPKRRAVTLMPARGTRVIVERLRPSALLGRAEQRNDQLRLP
jgi:hypothetical protein